MEYVMLQNLEILPLVISFTFGIFFERYVISRKELSAQSSAQVDFFSKEKGRSVGLKDYSDISIDDSKIVVDINTNNIETKHEGLGKTTESIDNTQSAVNKLKKMKGV